MAYPEQESEARLPSSEDLDLVAAEQQSAAETSVTSVNNIHIAKCFKCGVDASLTLCRHCGNEFCGDHRSKYSDQYCYLCIAPDNLGLDYLPLEEEELDADGNTVVHRGRRIKLIGEGWPNTMQMVCDLTDEGLEIFIAERQRLLKEAVATAEYHRITLSHAEFTLNYKKHSKAVKLQRRYAKLQQGTLRVGSTRQNMGTKAVKQATEDDKLMKLLGLTPEQFKAFKKVMNKA